MTDAERRQVLVTLRDFSSVAKTGTLNNLFLVTFAELVDRKTNNSVTQTETMLQLDVLIAILDKVKLKRENYLTLMQHVKIFVSDRSTQKKGYKLLTRVIERFELNCLDDIKDIKETITPLMLGQANKERINLINAFITAVKNL